MGERVGVTERICERDRLLAPCDRLRGVVCLHRDAGHLRVCACQLDSRRELFEDFDGLVHVDPRFCRASDIAFQPRAEPQDIPCPEELAGVAMDRERLVQRRERLVAQVRQKPLLGEPLQQLRPPLGGESRPEPQRAPVLVQSLAVRTDRRRVLRRRRCVPEHRIAVAGSVRVMREPDKVRGADRRLR